MVGGVVFLPPFDQTWLLNDGRLFLLGHVSAKWLFRLHPSRPPGSCLQRKSCCAQCGPLPLHTHRYTPLRRLRVQSPRPVVSHAAPSLALPGRNTSAGCGGTGGRNQLSSTCSPHLGSNMSRGPRGRQ